VSRAWAGERPGPAGRPQAAWCALACAAWACAGGGSGGGDPSAALSGGATTVFDRTSNAYSRPAPGLGPAELEAHRQGDTAFEAVFVTPPAPVNPGLGPLFNNVSCSSCHLRDGRGMPEAGNGPLGSQLLVRVSTAEGLPLPGVGAQLQDHAVFGVAPEAAVAVAWEELPGAYLDGSAYALRRPLLQVTLGDGSPLPAGTLTSLRLPPPVFGRGLLEAVPEEAILALADPDDADGDGISGRPNRVPDLAAGGEALGRFGLKANTASLLEQAAAAYRNDLGVTTSLSPEEDGSHELDDATLEAVTLYTRTLGVPARVDPEDPTVRRGEALFRGLGCAACHAPTLRTGPDPVPGLARQRIHPYSDLLLHDMGQGLADGRPDHLASGQEWRTAPLWGLGLVQTVLPGSTYLHDGRARTVEEAILWHGGEAVQSREAFRGAAAAEREALLRFLRSL
jgi:CxxC motif-containing protein (DUF1111 family)